MSLAYASCSEYTHTVTEPAAYFITFHTYGSRLHGHSDGSVDYHHRDPKQPALPPDPQREAASHQRMKHTVVILDKPARQAVLSAILETCEYRKWQLHAVHVRTTHVHVVVTASGTTAEKTMVDLKAYATRRLRKDQHLSTNAPAWSEHGSTRYLWDSDAITQKTRYTLHEQGNAMSHWPESTHE